MHFALFAPVWGALLPGYDPGRIIIDAAFADGFHAWTELELSMSGQWLSPCWSCSHA